MNKPGKPLDRIEQAVRSNRRGLAVQALRRLIQTGDDTIDLARAARIAAGLQDFHTAARAAEINLRRNPDNIGACIRFAEYAHACGRSDEAQTAVREAYEKAPDNPTVIYAMGYTLARSGKTEEAISYYRQAVLKDPSKSLAWSLIAKLRKIESPADPDLAAMRKHEALLEKAGPDIRAPLQYGLGYAMESLGDYDRAFDHIQTGAELMKARRGYDPATLDRIFEATLKTFTLSQIAGTRGVESDRPIFIVGAPRAGTTLVETVLLAHSAVTDGAELPFLSIASYPFQRFVEQAPQNFTAAVQRDTGIKRPFESFGATYLKLAEERFGTEGRFVDSTTTTPWQAGYVLGALPGAKIIWMTRDRRDAMWAIYKVFFPGTQSFSYDFGHIAHRLDWIARLRDHFQAIAPDRILPVAYEDLAREPDLWIRRILDFCGLPFENSVRDFHKSDRVVNSASFNQVRQPITARSVGSWRKYESRLAPIYGRLGLAD